MFSNVNWEKYESWMTEIDEYTLQTDVKIDNETWNVWQYCFVLVVGGATELFFVKYVIDRIVYISRSLDH
jgi:hypothetical protein